MTREEAIKILETEIECVKRESCERAECANCKLVMPVDRILGAYRMAITAILNQKQTGCEHCLAEYDREDWRDGNPHEMRIEGNNLFSYSTSDGWEGTEIRFCPWCGRALEGI